MATSNDPRLEQAQRLIKQGNKAEARQILAGLLKEDSENITALYLYAQAAANLQEMEKALNLVLKLDPMNYQARSALNKVQQRNIEQLRDDTDTPSVQARNTNFMLYAAIGLVAALAIIGVFLLLSSSDGEDGWRPPSTAENQDVISTNTLSPTERRGAANPTLPPTPTITLTFTPAPTNTPRPTRTPRPTNTTIPSRTPTPLSTEPISPNLLDLSRIYNDYVVLSIQVKQTEDPVRLEQISMAYQALIASIQLSNYNDGAIESGIVTFLDEFIILLEYEYDYVVDLQTALEQNQSIDTIYSQDRLNQQTIVQRQFEAIIGAATATAVVERSIDLLKTPTVTPIILPTVAP